MRIINLYADEAGESHFRDLDIDWQQAGKSNRLSPDYATSKLFFRESLRAFNVDWHCAPRRQFIINLDGRVKVTASDGESRTLQPGDVVLIEDTHGKGHLTENLDEQPRISIFVPLAED